MKTYALEVGEVAVQLVLAQDLTLEDASTRIATPKGTLANRISAANSGTIVSPAPRNRPVPELEAENAKLRKELAQARTKRDIVKEGGSILCAGAAAKYAVMKVSRIDFPIAVLCRAFGVSRSGYYS